MAKKAAGKPVASKKETAGEKTETAAAPSTHLSITVTGPPHEVRRALAQMSFAGGDWNPAVARTIALDETKVDDATLQDTLGGDRIRLFSSDARDLYRQRCVNKAGTLGHSVPDPSQIPDDSSTTVMEVGDALFSNARP